MFIGSFAAITNSADWQDSIAVTAADDGTPVNLSDGYLIEMRVYPLGPSGAGSDYGWQSSQSPALSGSTNDGTITTPEAGYLTFRFTKEQMSSVPAATYGVALRISKDDQFEQLVLSTVPVLFGGFY